MRHPYQAQSDLQLTPIEKIRLPLKSRDELPPILAGLQWLWMHPTLKAEILALIEAAVLADKKATGRTGMSLWQILVLGVVRLGLDADWDRMEHIANYDTLVRQMLQVPATPWGAEDKMFGHQNPEGQRRAAGRGTVAGDQCTHRRCGTRGVRKKSRRARRGA